MRVFMAYKSAEVSYTPRRSSLPVRLKPRKVAVLEADVKALIIQRTAKKKATGPCTHLPRTCTTYIYMKSDFLSSISSALTCMTNQLSLPIVL